ncbi:N-acetyltransferase [Acrocarpospora pleiomorpha]|uniref:N-acetyltransferase n=1 Tax=Acrocarpospora pleiomorpha TaxID=90975 RepID=A0A5M3XW55_9ACTN|nr:N-acetyltransferase [Acrocarpospora pleiomorpha]
MLDVLTEAFMNDPLVCWLFPKAAERGHLQSHFYRPLLTHPAAEAYLAGRLEGASVWLTLAAGQTPHEEQPDASEAGQHAVFGTNGARLLALGQALAPRHPDREPHLYLPCMGVISGRQGSGLGSAMLRHRLARADADGLPAYLEASSPRSRALYQRHGFEDLGEQVRVADSPLLWPMWRPPQH